METKMTGSVYVNNTAKAHFWHLERKDGVWHATEVCRRRYNGGQLLGKVEQLDEAYSASLEKSISSMLERHLDSKVVPNIYAMLKVYELGKDACGFDQWFFKTDLDVTIEKAYGNWYLKRAKGRWLNEKFDRIEEIVEQFTGFKVA